MGFELQSQYTPQGDQGQAIAKLAKSLQAGNRHQTLLGVTGSGKTFTMAKLIEELGKPTLVMSHNKTLAAQLYSELKSFFPENAVEYFVSYFDYYQPEAYIPRSDTYIEKDSSINDEIERLRLSTMGSLLTRRDVVVVASVSCIYGLGSPEDYANMMLPLRVGEEYERSDLLARLVDLLYERNDIDFQRGRFRVRGDVVEIFPASVEGEAIRIEFFDEEIERISAFEPLTGKVVKPLERCLIEPAKQFVTSKEKMERAMKAIKEELEQRVNYFEKKKQYVESQRIRQRTEYDLEMMREMGFCQGIENYSRHLRGVEKGATPATLMDFFADDALLILDESHVTIPQIGGMYEGDRSRKSTLVEHGFRLPSALDNRPLQFAEFMQRENPKLYVSATPGAFELLNSRPDNRNWLEVAKPDAKQPAWKSLQQVYDSIKTSGNAESVEEFDPQDSQRCLVVEQIIRPTGLLDPVIEVLPLEGQIDATMELCRQRIAKKERVLVTTLTKRTAEELTDYLQELKFKVRYIHADVDAVERVRILRSLRAGECDVLVGINLLREGLDLPEVSLVCILDADKEGYLRSASALIQTAGRAARHEEGKVVLFADEITGSMQQLLVTTKARREIQQQHNLVHGIVPKSVRRGVQASLSNVEEEGTAAPLAEVSKEELLAELQREMVEAASKLEFERAAHLRDQIRELERD